MRVVSLTENEFLLGAFARINKLSWPNFLLEGSEPVPYCWPTIMSEFAFCQLILVDDTGAALAVANAVPIFWDGTLSGLPSGWDDTVLRSISGHELHTAANTLVALSITISPERQGTGLSYKMLEEIKRVAEKSGFAHLIVPVRPSLKPMYPLTSIEKYVGWKDGNNNQFDPWLRAHIKSGGKILKICHRSMTVRASITDWEGWAGMKFPESGEYIVPKALNPVIVSVEQSLGTYVEPNVWVQHA